MLPAKPAVNARMFVALFAVVAFATTLVWWATKADQVRAQGPTLEYTLTGGQFVPFGGEPWLITDGCMSWQLFDVLPHDGLQVAVYEVVGFSINVVGSTSTPQTLNVIPDGLPSPFFSPGIPGFEPDSGLVNVFSDGFLDMIIYDLSIDGQPVDQQDIIGGPALLGPPWNGVFPEPTSFSVSTFAGLPSLGLFGEFSLTGELLPCTTPVATVDIDIKPGSDPNSINTNSKGTMPVAILSSDEFDATTVNKDSLTFGAKGDEDSLAKCTKSNEDVNDDGLLDIVCHFNTQDTGFQAGDTEGILRGQTLDGEPIEGRDSVRIVGQ